MLSQSRIVINLLLVMEIECIRSQPNFHWWWYNPFWHVSDSFDTNKSVEFVYKHKLNEWHYSLRFIFIAVTCQNFNQIEVIWFSLFLFWFWSQVLFLFWRYLSFRLILYLFFNEISQPVNLRYIGLIIHGRYYH